MDLHGRKLNVGDLLETLQWGSVRVLHFGQRGGVDFIEARSLNGPSRLSFCWWVHEFNDLSWPVTAEQRPKEGNMELDLTKPMRVKKDARWVAPRGRRFWPAAYPPINPGYIRGIVEGYTEWQELRLDDLENIPAPVKHTLYVVAVPGDGPVVSSTPQKWSGMQKITVWRDENGKTCVEVCDD